MTAFPKPTKKPKRPRKRPLPKASALEARLWRAFSLHVRLRDRGRCCMTGIGNCGGVLQAGHLISRRYRATRYDETNVFAQCEAHNAKHQGNPHEMTMWYIGRYGVEAYASLVARAAVLTKRPNRSAYMDLIARYECPPVSGVPATIAPLNDRESGSLAPARSAASAASNGRRRRTSA